MIGVFLILDWAKAAPFSSAISSLTVAEIKKLHQAETAAPVREVLEKASAPATDLVPAMEPDRSPGKDPVRYPA